jgi:hypothetical protein
MQRQKLPLLIAALAALAAALAAFLVPWTPSAETPAVGRSQRAAPERTSRLAGAGATAVERARPREAGPAAAPSAACGALDEPSLIAALRALGELDGLGDPRLPAHLAPLLRAPDNALRTLQLLRERRLAGHAWTPAARGGAVLLLTVASAAYAAPPAEGELAGLEVRVDGRALVLALLNDLHAFADVVRARLVESLRAVRLEGRLVLDASYLDAILRLRALHPEARAAYGELLLLVADDLGADERAALHTLFVSETDDPTLMKVALANLLRSADGAPYVQLAARLLADGALDARVRRELLQAVAASAPVDAAATLLAEHARASDLAQATTLGMRRGGAEALGVEYTRLVTNDTDPAARRLLVAGMALSDHGALLGITRTDPHDAVRGQALVSLSVGAGAPPAGALEQLETGWRERRDPFTGIPAADATTAAGNLARRTRGAERERALDVLREVARAAEVEGTQRARALATLGRYVTEEEHAALLWELEDR